MFESSPMKMFYITLRDVEQAQKISQALIENRIAACTNWWPMQSCYRWEGKICFDNEVVMIVKTKAHQRTAIEAVVAEHLDYINCIAEIDVASVNKDYAQWLDAEANTDSE